MEDRYQTLQNCAVIEGLVLEVNVQWETDLGVMLVVFHFLQPRGIRFVVHYESESVLG